MRKQIAHASAKAHYWRAAQTTVALIFVVLLTAFTAVLFLLSFSEISLLLTFDYLWWVHCRAKGILVARYDTVHFGRQEMQSIFEHSLEIKDSLIVFEGLSLNAVHNRIMAAVITTTAVLENSFRRAYLAVPVYEFPISNRKALREKYSYVGCNLDRLIKQVRILLEMRHTSGLLSITSSTGTIEASLHNNIESILSVAIYFKSAVLYNIVSRIAHFESLIEERIASNPNLTGEAITRERVVYIDARNAMFWILWILVTKEWHDPHAFWAAKTVDKLDEEEAEKVRLEFPDSKTDVLYVIATFLSRCRYCDRYGFQNEQEFYPEVRAIGIAHGKDSIEQEFDTLSACLEKHRSLTLLDWAAREYKISWVNSDRSNGPLRCTWEDDAGAAMQAQCQIVLL